MRRLERRNQWFREKEEERLRKEEEIRRAKEEEERAAAEARRKEREVEEEKRRIQFEKQRAKEEEAERKIKEERERIAREAAAVEREREREKITEKDREPWRAGAWRGGGGASERSERQNDSSWRTGSASAWSRNAVITSTGTTEKWNRSGGGPDEERSRGGDFRRGNDREERRDDRRGGDRDFRRENRREDRDNVSNWRDSIRPNDRENRRQGGERRDRVDRGDRVDRDRERGNESGKDSVNWRTERSAPREDKDNKPASRRQEQQSEKEWRSGDDAGWTNVRRR